MDKHILQEANNKLTSCSEKWQLHFNPTKCKHLTYGKPKYDSTYTMTNTDGGVTDINNTPETEKDIGVTFNRSLKFRQHIGTVVNKTNQIIGLISSYRAGMTKQKRGPVWEGHPDSSRIAFWVS